MESLGERKYEQTALGFNYRMGALHTAVGLGQLPRLEAMVEKRNRNAAYLRERLAGVLGILPPREAPGYRHAYYKFVCRIDREVLDVDASTAVEAIKAEGVPATPRYPTTLPYAKGVSGEDRLRRHGLPLRLPPVRPGIDYPEGLLAGGRAHRQGGLRAAGAPFDRRTRPGGRGACGAEGGRLLPQTGGRRSLKALVDKACNKT